MTPNIRRALAQETLIKPVRRATKAKASLQQANDRATAAIASKPRMQDDYYHSTRPVYTTGPRVAFLT